MSKIKIKTVGWLEVEYNRGKYLEKLWLDKAVDREQKIAFGDFTGVVNDISGFRHEKPEVDKNKINFDNNSSSHQEYMSYRKETLVQSFFERSKNLGTFKCLYAASYFIDPSDDILEQARALQESFYRSNPKRCLPDPQIFKGLLKKKNIGYGIINTIMGAVNQDMQMALRGC